MIYYSHVNEDNRAERLYFQNHPASNLLAIAGSGERIIAMIDLDHLDIINAVDKNSEALYLLELKIALLKQFDTETYLKIIGHDHALPAVRLEAFASIKHLLSNDCRDFWSKHSTAIKSGILYAGHFEIFLARIRPWITFLLGATFLTRVFELSKPLDGISLIRWRMVKFLFNFKFIYRFFGNKDTAFIGAGSQLTIISDALDKCFRKGKGKENFMCHLIFKGHLRDMEKHKLPPSLQKPILDKIRNKLLTNKIQIKIIHQDLLEYQIKNSNPIPDSTFYSISDILSFEDFPYLRKFLTQVSNKGNMVVWRSFLRNQLSDSDITLLQQQFGTVEILSQIDTTGMYKVYGFNF